MWFDLQRVTIKMKGRIFVRLHAERGGAPLPLYGHQIVIV